MRLAALYDIHGNIDALDAVLDEIESLQIDLIVVGGDIAWGAFPRETVERVQSLGDRAISIRGNADREVLSPPKTDEPGRIDDVTRWCLGELGRSQKAHLRDLPLTRTAETEGWGEVLFCHGTPRSDDEIFTAVTPDEEVAAIFKEIEQELIVCGHTHTQFNRRIGRHRVVNAGSVGMPYEDDPGAYWAIIGEGIELRRTQYDFTAAAERMRRSGCPHVDGFANAVISPLGRGEAIDKFESARHSAHSRPAG